MPMTLDMSPELEKEVRRQALKAGIDAEEFVLSVLEENFMPSETSNAAVPHLSAEESRLLQAINQGLPEETWHRYHELVAKRRDETISPSERNELIRLTDRIEGVNVQRFGKLTELALLRGVDVQRLMRDLGIPDPGYV